MAATDQTHPAPALAKPGDEFVEGDQDAWIFLRLQSPPSNLFV